MIAEHLPEKTYTQVFIACSPDDQPARKFMKKRLERDCRDIRFVEESDLAPFSPMWMLECRRTLADADKLLCLIGQSTWRLKQTIWLMNTAIALGKEIVGIKMQPEQLFEIPRPLVVNNFPIIDWHSAELASYLSLEKLAS